MNPQDEIQVVDVDPGDDEHGYDNGFRYANRDVEPALPEENGIPLSHFGPQNMRNTQAITSPFTDEGLPIQQYQVQNRIFLRRQVQMMAISITPNSLRNRANYR